MHRNVAKLLDQFKITCRYFDQCQQILPYKELRSHELDCPSCDSCLRKCPKCNTSVTKLAFKSHICADTPVPRAPRGFFLSLFGSSGESETTEPNPLIVKQLKQSSDITPITRVGRPRADPFLLHAGLDDDDNFHNAEELIAQQRALIDAIQNRSFWGVRAQSLMQYYPNVSGQTANSMIVLMMVDPLVQNFVILSLNDYLYSSLEEGGCCYGQSLYRATFAFTVIYMVFVFVNACLTTMLWNSMLTPSVETSEGGLRKSRKARFLIFIACLFNLHLCLFAMAPSLHRYFDMQ